MEFVANGTKAEMHRSFIGEAMFTHEITINTTHSIHQLKLDLADNNMHIYDFSDESFVFHEEMFWTKAFLRPMVKCITKSGNTIGLRFYLRKIDNLLLSLYLANCGAIALLTLLIESAEELPLVIMLWTAISLLMFWLYFKKIAIVSLKNSFVMSLSPIYRLTITTYDIPVITTDTMMNDNMKPQA